MQSILTSIKKLLGLSQEDTAFDLDIIMHINTVFSILTQLGVGPSNGFSIQDETAIWADFIPEGQNFESIKTYMYLKVRLIFDPPVSAAVAESMKRTIDELEWRLNVQSETKNPSGKEELQNG